MKESISRILKYASQRREPFYEIVKKYIKPDSIILDIGAGNGSFAKFIGRNDIFMIDGNPETVVNNQKFFPNYQYVHLPDLPFQNNKFDIIHCSHVIEHLTPNDFFLLLKNCDRCLKIGGYIIISSPLMWYHFWDDLSHVRPYSPRIFEKYLCEKSSPNSTREKISNKYSIIELQYRYHLTEIGADVINTRSSIVNQVYRIVMQFLTRVGFRRIEKTGYTIVLKKS
ncbi:MAG TPA: class I SAM-dependent methyltransferase [Candidatus Marinimicrobia bacterium]|nr:class I SAM-dependent methyltransferase [Candidatus Neomarinimicrobiota bacterium]HRS91700.1 class I SAM-dependent methyltransferase [Candidatus Neomarinimicrobiota bacterium]